MLGVRRAGATPFWLRDRIALDYRGSIVSLDFGVLDFTLAEAQPARVSHGRASRTTGSISARSAASRSRISTPGDHVLEVRAANSDSVWSAQPLQLHDPPRSGAVALAVGLRGIRARWCSASSLHRIRRHRQKFPEVVRARERLEAEVQLRTRELVESNRQLAEAARAKSNFLDRMSHELRTPMNGVVGMTELLSRTALSATQTHLTKTIRSSAQILLQIVNDLLDLSKIRAGKVVLEALPIDLGQVLEECTSLFAGSAETKGIELIVCPPARARAECCSAIRCACGRF